MLASEAQSQDVLDFPFVLRFDLAAAQITDALIPIEDAKPSHAPAPWRHLISRSTPRRSSSAHTCHDFDFLSQRGVVHTG